METPMTMSERSLAPPPGMGMPLTLSVASVTAGLKVGDENRAVVTGVPTGGMVGKAAGAG